MWHFEQGWSNIICFDVYKTISIISYSDIIYEDFFQKLLKVQAIYLFLLMMVGMSIGLNGVMNHRTIQKCCYLMKAIIWWRLTEIDLDYRKIIVN